ncbi:hypothetical protein FHW58_001327 [Duganella sp. 1224]|uniref:hypothetical protein n=1 Tax=Duganella sp. 1224 TaxID=2587052 RepID=UPI00183DD75E|nr:hypothetical protein [Duganella sp. 1224]NYE60175.1 hypothetical protein [Duganella sp. 1224]
MKTRFSMLLCALLAARSALAAQPSMQSASKLSFGDADTLFVADWQGARIFALTLPAPASPAGKPFNLQDVQAPIANALGVAPAALRFEDLAVQPGSELAYIALTVRGAKGRSRPAIVSVDAAGKVRRLDLSKAAASAAITDAPAADARFWRDLPQQTLTVTDMRYYQNKLYVAGLSNRSFASTLRVYDYPFNGKASATTIEMYHPVHNQIETRAPIRSMTVMNIGGEPTLVAAYTCTPLVTIPLKDLQDGAHITARTVGELGWGSAPNGLVSFKAGEAEYALLVNSSRSADLLSAADLASAAAQPGVSTPIDWPAKPYLGVKATMTPMSAVMRIDNLNPQLLLALRRADAGGEMQLVSIPKGGYLRLSDFVNEYDFPDYRYPEGDKFRDFHQYARTLEGYADLAR